VAITLPPCVRSMMSNWKDEYSIYVASYLKTHVSKDAPKALSDADLWGKPEVASSLIRLWRSAPPFNCTLIKQTYPQFCDEELCPLRNLHNPVDFIVQHLTEPPTYIVQSGKAGTFRLTFRNRVVDLPVVQALRAPKDHLNAIFDAISDAFGVNLDASDVPMDDEGKPDYRGLMSNLLKKLRQLDLRRIVENDPLGLADVLEDMLSGTSSTVVVRDIRSRDEGWENVVYYNEAKKAFYIPPEVLWRAIMRMGIRISIPVLTRTLRDVYGIPKVRTSRPGRPYMYLFDEPVLKRLLNAGFDEVLSHVSINAGAVEKLAETVMNMGGGNE